jgi:hypothetical protein
MAELTDFYWKRHDTAEPIVIRCLQADGTTPIVEDLTGAEVEFHMMSADATVLVPAGAGEVIDAAGKVIGYQPVAGDTDVASTADAPHEAEFQVTLADGRVMTFPNFGNLSVHIYPDIA